jgi:hypothetical protein
VLIKFTLSSRLTKQTSPKKQMTRKKKSRKNIIRTSNQQSHAMQDWKNFDCHTSLFKANVSIKSVQILYTIQHNMQSLRTTATKVIGSQFNTIQWNVKKVVDCYKKWTWNVYIYLRRHSNFSVMKRCNYTWSQCSVW